MYDIESIITKLKGKKHQYNATYIGTFISGNTKKKADKSP